MAKKRRTKEQKRKDELMEKINRVKSVRAALNFDKISCLAFDPATNCGWAQSTNDFGTVNLAQRKGESYGMKWVRMELLVNELFDKYDPVVVGIEQPITRHQGATIHHSKLVGVIEKVCAEREVEFINISPTEVKKFATGNGRASKEEMIEAASKWFGYLGTDDNEADALWILNFTKKKVMG